MKNWVKKLASGWAWAALALLLGAKLPLPAAGGEPGSPDPKVLKQTEAILSQRFSRDPGELLRHLERLSIADPVAMPVNDRFLLRFVTGEWGKVHEELMQMPPELARRIYDKMLADLADSRKPNARLEDILGLADAVPGELSADNLRRIGQLLSATVPATETYWLADRLRRGTGQLGGADPAKRLNAARALIAGNFKELARSYLPPLAEIDQLPDEALRTELHNFLATQEERESAQRGEVMRVWDENISLLVNPPATRSKSAELNKASNALVKILTQVPAQLVSSALAEVVTSNPEGAIHLVSAFVRKVQSERGSDPAVRTENVAAQSTIANLLVESVDPAQQPWHGIFELMADHWIGEAETTYQLAGQKNQRLVLAEELLSGAPAGKWFAALSTEARDRIDVCTARLILTGSRFDQAAERIVEIGKRSPAAGAALAGDFLAVWAKTHNPQLPEELRKRYGLPEDARIPVTPVMMEKNIDSLARMMSLFREAGLAPADSARVVTAFDLAYGSAETYRASHIEKVFGPMTQMEEPVFLQILTRMAANLGDRWRKMDVQRGNLTRRDEAQTLELVRHGYATALQMIDGWLVGHPESWRLLTLAGSALTDWGDFEYFQQLAVGDPNQRMLGFKEKNLQAQEYFDRAARAYSQQVPKLAQAEYTVEPHLAWFHALLGIGSNNQLNLSKPVNRAALAKIRDHLSILPGKAAQQHVSLFARVANARLNDEREPLHEDLKYRYLASALVITKDDPFTLGAAKKLTYYDELLREVRLQTRVDGPNTVGRDQDFGVIFSIVHTDAMGRAARFGQYLSNDSNVAGSKSRGRPPFAKKMGTAQGARDELEMNLTEALAPFFEIKSITFATPDVKPRPTAQPGWEETVFAYLHVRAKDASVDKIPPVELPLKFIDMTGPVSIPAESPETVINVATDGAAPRPASHLEITQTLDTRQLLINGTLTLEIKATATGLVPELEQLLAFDPKSVIAVGNINPHGGLQVKELNTWAAEVAPVSERLWSIALNADAVRTAREPLEYRFPLPKDEGTAVVIYQTYQDMNLTRLDQPVTMLGQRAEVAPPPPAESGHPPIWVVAGILSLASGVAVFLLRKGRSPGGPRAPAIAENFPLPVELDGFAVSVWLRRLERSPLVKLAGDHRQELQGDLQRVEQSCFGLGGEMTEADLRSLAMKWLSRLS